MNNNISLACSFYFTSLSSLICYLFSSKLNHKTLKTDGASSENYLRNQHALTKIIPAETKINF